MKGFTCTSELPALVVECFDLPHDPLGSDSLGPDELAGGGGLELLRAGPHASADG